MDSMTIEDIYNAGALPALHKAYHDKRMPMNNLKFLTPKARKIWKNYIQYRWRKKHPEFVKKQNDYFAAKYRTEKPFICTCKYCGQQFNAPKNCYQICPTCSARPSKKRLKQLEIEQRRLARQASIEEARFWYSKGITQEVLAEDFGVAQKTISNWVRGVKK